jgi:hypothetical protein
MPSQRGLVQSRRPYKFSEAAQSAALRAYSESGSIPFAAAAAGVCIRTLERHRVLDADFNEAWQDARARYTARLEAEAFRRGVEGHVGEDGVRRFDSALLIALLKRHAPEKYAPTRRPPLSLDGLSPAERDELRAKLEADVAS